jgi:hypothetical protein
VKRAVDSQTIVLCVMSITHSKVLCFHAIDLVRKIDIAHAEHNVNAVGAFR